MFVAIILILTIMAFVLLPIFFRDQKMRARSKDRAKIDRRYLSVGDRPSDLVHTFLPLLHEATDTVEIHEEVGLYNESAFVESIRRKLAAYRNFSVHASINGEEPCQFIDHFQHESRVTIIFRKKDNDMRYKIIDDGKISHLYNPADGYKQLDLRNVSDDLRKEINRESLNRWRKLGMPNDYRRESDGSWIPVVAAVGADGGGGAVGAGADGGGAGC